MTEGSMQTSGSRWAMARKALAGVAAFILILGGWLWMRNRAEAAESALIAASPLPDARAPDSYCSLWFVGSSSMHQWKQLSTDMLPWDAHNRGISGASLGEITRRFNNGAPGRLPRAIVFYAGENDIAFGVSVKHAFGQLRTFITEKRRRMGATPLLIVSLKPSPLRWEKRAAQTEFNDAAQALARAEPDLIYVDVVSSLLVRGRPGPFYSADGLHLNRDGYRVLKTAVRKVLDRSLPTSLVQRCSGNVIDRNG
ncbi:MAG: putative lysophospholipase [Sphingomonas bacterium]|nr:putative lysophospholipase [Sphingomonas bacterium]